MISRFLPSVFFCTVLLAACAPVTQNQMASRGGTALEAKDIFDLVSGNTLQVESIDFNSSLYFLPDGNLIGRGESLTRDDNDKGGWDINGDNQLCLKFKVWYYGELRCYAVYKDSGKNTYALFNDKGAIAYTAKSASGDAAHLFKAEKSKKKDTFLRENLAAGSTAAPVTEAAAPPPAPEPDKKDAYLRESLAAGKTAETVEEAVTVLTEAAAPAVASDAPMASDEEVGHTVKSMAKNCPGCNLEKSDLRQADLVGANLQGANLKGADLSRANLRRANLSGADLTGAVLLNTNLPGANLQNATLVGADFSGSNLVQADLTGAKTSNTILTNTHLEGVKGLK